MSNQKPDIRPQPFFGLPNIKCRIYYLREASIYDLLGDCIALNLRPFG